MEGLPLLCPWCSLQLPDCELTRTDIKFQNGILITPHFREIIIPNFHLLNNCPVVRKLHYQSFEVKS